MSFLHRLFASPGARAANAAKRWVVVDTETTGLNPENDALVAIGGVAVDEDGIRPEDSFEIVVRHTGATDAANIVVHGLGRAALDAGVPAPEALGEFRDWVDDAPCVGFHTDFDRRVLSLAARRCSVAAVVGPWLDLAPLAAALRPDVPRSGTGSLDDWLTAYGIDCVGRHNAAMDALATAELLLRLKAVAAEQGVVGFAALAALAGHRRWLGPQS